VNKKVFFCSKKLNLYLSNMTVKANVFCGIEKSELKGNLLNMFS